MKKYVWYFSKENKFAVVDNNTDWYWDWFCLTTEGVIRLGEL